MNVEKDLTLWGKDSRSERSMSSQELSLEGSRDSDFFFEEVTEEGTFGGQELVFVCLLEPEEDVHEFYLTSDDDRGLGEELFEFLGPVSSSEVEDAFGIMRDFDGNARDGRTEDR